MIWICLCFASPEYLIYDGMCFAYFDNPWPCFLLIYSFIGKYNPVLVLRTNVSVVLFLHMFTILKRCNCTM